MKRIKQTGVTLLEVLLVLAIASMLLIMGIRQYMSFRTESDAHRVLYNVDAIFLAMSYFYKAQCNGSGSGSSFQPGLLNPRNAKYQENISINIQTDLIDQNYLAQTIVRIPIVDTSGIGMLGYVAQFNMDDSQKRKICVQGTNATGLSATQGCDQTETIGTIVSAQAQVAVQMKNEQTAKVYLNVLGGDCLSTASGNIVQPCTTKPGSGTYIVWQRLPSFASPTVQQNQSSGNVVVNQFTQEYTTYPASYLISNNGTGPSNNEQYFLCGS